MTRAIGPLLCIICTTVSAAWAQLSPPSIGELPPLSFKSEQEPINLLIASLNVSSIYDDNLLLNNAKLVTDVSYEVRSGISFDLSRTRFRWALNTSPGVTFHQHITQRDLFTNSLGTTLEYQFTPHLSAKVRGSFAIRDNPFYDSEESNLATAGAPSLLDTSNSLVLTPLAKRTSEQAGADVVYALGPRTTVQLSGSFYNLHFDNLVHGSTENLTDSQFTNGRAQYVHRLSRRHSGGFIYNFQDLHSSGGHPIRTVTDSFLYSHSVEFSHFLNLQLFAGPEYSLTHEDLMLPFLGGTIDLPLTGRAWSWAAGGSFGWQGTHGSVRAGFRHQVQNGGGLPGAAHHTSATFEVRRKLIAGWVGNAAVSYGENNLINLAGPSSMTRAIVGGVGARHKLGKDLSLDLHYSRAHQEGGGELTNRTGDIDRATVTLEYKFKRPLGR